MLRNPAWKTAAWAMAFAITLQLTAATSAQQPAAAPGEEADLAKKLSNPISDLVSVPFQFNWEQNVGPAEQTRFILNVQPVMPFALNERGLNLIARVIMPLVSQPPLFEGGESAVGVADIFASFFLSPARGGLIWGVGPAISLPSNTIPTLGTEKWSAGPTVVVLKQSGLWTYGALWNQVWSFSGNSNRADVNQMFLQPFLAYQATQTVTLTLQSETSANWEVDDDRWSVPINVLVSKLSSFGTFPASYQIGFGGFAAHPEIGPSWKLRGAIVILLPRRRDSIMKTVSSAGVLLIGGLFAGAAMTVTLAQSAKTGPSVKPAAVATKAAAPPPAGAKTTKAAGKNKVTVSTANHATDDDSFWIEKIDIDGDGNVEDSNLVWDDEDKILFAYSTGTFTCKNGGTGEADMLVATYAAGNTLKKPTGSGFWVVDVDKGECAAQAAGLLGCRFDASGNETACGMVTIDEKNDDIVIVTATK